VDMIAKIWCVRSWIGWWKEHAQSSERFGEARWSS